MAVDLLRQRVDAHDRRRYREWLTCTVDIYASTGSDEAGESQYDEDPDNPDSDTNATETVPSLPTNRKVPCFIDMRRRRIQSSTQELVLVDATVDFKPSQAVKIGDILKNGLQRNGVQVLDEVRVFDFASVPHQSRGSLMITALCQLH